MKMNDFADAVKTNPNKPNFIRLLPAYGGPADSNVTLQKMGYHE
jgi:hypothetical protein